MTRPQGSVHSQVLDRCGRRPSVREADRIMVAEEVEAAGGR